ncbi:MAG TPA: TPM domain-containing protein, partial [Vicinamibacteria bacterium]|nr:TPM domain-containing protein [Vicinamibacteria bacterium]
MITALFLAAAVAGGQEQLPPPPARYLNDYAGVVPSAAAQRLDDTLRRFDEETSSQVVVAIFPDLPSPSLEDFTARTAESWKVGRKELDNGAVLFVFVNDRKIRLEVGYGLEGALPDVTARHIIDE